MERKVLKKELFAAVRQTQETAQKRKWYLEVPDLVRDLADRKNRLSSEMEGPIRS